MKQKLIVVAILSTMSGASMAGSLLGGPEANANAAASAGAAASAHVDSRNSNANVNSLSNRNVGVNKQVQNQGQKQGQLQGQTASSIQGQSQGSNFQGQSADNAGNSQSIVYQYPANQVITNNGRSQLETVPNVYAPNIYPTSPCMGSSSAGASWLGFGMSGGTSWTDEECQKQEAARNAPTPADRIYVWCKSKHAEGSPSCAGAIGNVDKQAALTPPDSRRAEVATVQESGSRVAPGMEAWVLAPRH